MRRSFFAIMAVLFSTELQASTQINLLYGSQVDGPYTFAGPCYCADEAYATGFFAVVPGSTVDFGMLVVGPTQGFSHYGDPPSQLNFSFLVNTNRSDPIYYASPFEFDFSGDNSLSAHIYDLRHYVIPVSANYIQFSWLGPYSYTASDSVVAVPELSTWAMMILGALGLSLVTHQRRSRMLLKVA
ncbi:hypothetical protein [Bradyrhizobium sp.]|uniref:hypothetical protein n=1 Tax=Bradyrhizobium sp. TaxID=376 RepID=UPI0007C9914E|nr:hypothetical protein [Bradyrhizobium sp.]